jgi:hypothetical protein
MTILRVFAMEDRGIMKYINYLKASEWGGAAACKVELCDPYTWQPDGATPKEEVINLHLDTPVRLAVPWAHFNAYAILDIPMEWEWVTTDMQLRLNREALEDRELALRELRWMWKRAKKHAGAPALPVAPPKGTPPPKIGIITITRNRPEWWYNMVKNVAEQQWPVSHLEWIIVDDSDPEKRLTRYVEELRKKAPALTITYVELDTPLSIGEKRNRAVRAASADVSVFAVMDDDDHYPPGSLALRASWLTRPGTQIAYCSTLPMYDIRKYVSACNVPPLEDPPSMRVSEATLCFTRAAWEETPFQDVNMAEGDQFLWGRDAISVEIPAGGVIVSFIHKANTSSRRIPESQAPNGSHYGFTDAYFEWLCRTGGAESMDVSGSSAPSE